MRVYRCIICVRWPVSDNKLCFVKLTVHVPIVESELIVFALLTNMFPNDSSVCKVSKHDIIKTCNVIIK